MEIFSLLLLGIIAGTLADLLGGGIVIIPILPWIFGNNVEIPTAHFMHVALCTSLATIVITSLSSIAAHHRHQAVQWSIFLRFTSGIIIGAALGAIIANTLSSETLRIIFAIFILFISAQLSFIRPPALYRQLPRNVHKITSTTKPDRFWKPVRFDATLWKLFCACSKPLRDRHCGYIDR